MRKVFDHISKSLQKKDGTAIVIAIVIALATIRLVEALVNSVFMPILSLFSASSNWRLMTIEMGRLVIPVGVLISEIIIFLMLLWFIFGMLLQSKDEE